MTQDTVLTPRHCPPCSGAPQTSRHSANHRLSHTCSASFEKPANHSSHSVSGHTLASPPGDPHLPRRPQATTAQSGGRPQSPDLLAEFLKTAPTPAPPARGQVTCSHISLGVAPHLGVPQLHGSRVQGCPPGLGRTGVTRSLTSEPGTSWKADGGVPQAPGPSLDHRTPAPLRRRPCPRRRNDVGGESTLSTPQPPDPQPRASLSGWVSATQKAPSGNRKGFLLHWHNLGALLGWGGRELQRHILGTEGSWDLPGGPGQSSSRSFVQNLQRENVLVSVFFPPGRPGDRRHRWHPTLGLPHIRAC